MAGLALVVLAFGLIISVYAESDDVQEYRNRYTHYERYDHNRDSGENHKTWENRPSRRDYNNKGRYSYDKYKNWNNDPDYQHSGKGNGKYDTDYHGNEHKNSDWASRYDHGKYDTDSHGNEHKNSDWASRYDHGKYDTDSHGNEHKNSDWAGRYDHNRGDSHRNKGRKRGWNNDRDSRGRHRDNYQRKKWNNRDNYGSEEEKGHGYDYHDKKDRIDNKPWNTGGYDDNNNDKQNNRGHNENDSGHRYEFDTPSHGADPCGNHERSSSEEHTYDTIRNSWNKPNTDSESTSNFGPTKNDHYNNRNSQSNRGKGNSYEDDRSFEDNGEAREDAISGQIPKHNSHIAGPYEKNHRDRNEEHRYYEDETTENTNNNNRKTNSYGSKTVNLSNNNDEISKNNQHTKVSANHLVGRPGETKNNKERIDSNDRSIIDSISYGDDELIKTVPNSNQYVTVSANDQIDRQQSNAQRQEDAR